MRLSPHLEVAVICAALTLPVAAVAYAGGAATERRDFAGFYEVAATAADGGAVQVTLHLRIFNFGRSDLERATIEVAGASTPVSIPRRQSVRLSVRAQASRDEVESWLRGAPPRVTIQDDGDAARPRALRSVELLPMVHAGGRRARAGAHAPAAAARPAATPALGASAAPLSTVAGGGPSHRPATSVALGWPGPLAVDASGNLYFTDDLAKRIFRIDPTGQLTVLAGSGADFYVLDGGTSDGPALDALFGTFAAMIATPSGALLTLDRGYQFGPDEVLSSLRRIDPTTLLANLLAYGYPDACPSFGPYLGGLAWDGAGRVYVSDEACEAVRRFDPITGQSEVIAGNGLEGFEGDGGPATEARLLYPGALSVDAAGNLYILDRGNFRIRRVEAATGLIATVAGDGTYGSGGDGGPATSASISPRGFAVDGGGNIFIADEAGNRIRRVNAATGIISNIAGTGEYGFGGDGGPASAATLAFPGAIILDGAGDVLLSDVGNHRVRRIDAATGIITTVAGGGASDPGDGRPATDAILAGPTRVEALPGGDLLILDSGQSRVRRLDGLTGIISTVAGGGTGGDGAPATQARLDAPTGVTAAPGGDLYISEAGGRVRRVEAATGLITTLVDAGLVHPTDVALDAAGDLYVTDAHVSPESGLVVRIDTATGAVTTVAGGGSDHIGEGIPATTARLLDPSGIDLDGAGGLYITERWGRVRKVDAVTGEIRTVAGGINNVDGNAGDGGPATQSGIFEPAGVSVAPGGDLYIATGRFTTDYQFLGRARKVDAATGIIDTVATTLGFVAGVALDSRGNLFFADVDNNRIRRASLVSRPPAAVAGDDITAECGGAVFLDGSASSDPDSTPGTSDDIVSFEWFDGMGTPAEVALGSGETLGVTLPPGRHSVTLIVTDSRGERRADQINVDVNDTTAPALSLDPGRTILWPPSHRMIPTTVAVTASDVCGGASWSLVSVTSNEADDTPGSADGDTTNDIQGVVPGTADSQFSLRAERSSSGTGRVYAITYSATDPSGNTTTATVHVSVPLASAVSAPRPPRRAPYVTASPSRKGLPRP
ncbi:MAG TPA: hypothetical protein VGK94_06155 [Candidatus Polarisedimenticolia bacterium]|jgi:sugar lactone lactonase YvrE